MREESEDLSDTQLQIDLTVAEALLYNLFVRFSETLTEQEWRSIAKALECLRIVKSNTPKPLESYQRYLIEGYEENLAQIRKIDAGKEVA